MFNITSDSGYTADFIHGLDFRVSFNHGPDFVIGYNMAWMSDLVSMLVQMLQIHWGQENVIFKQ
eukprot:15009525-Ditylum_brightwellii.AAC.1